MTILVCDYCQEYQSKRESMAMRKIQWMTQLLLTRLQQPTEVRFVPTVSTPQLNRAENGARCVVDLAYSTSGTARFLTPGIE